MRQANFAKIRPKNPVEFLIERTDFLQVVYFKLARRFVIYIFNISHEYSTAPTVGVDLPIYFWKHHFHLYADNLQINVGDHLVLKRSECHTIYVGLEGYSGVSDLYRRL